MEVEIKLHVNPAVEGGPIRLFARLTGASQLAEHPLGPVGRHEIRDLYYDTDAGALAAAGAGLRFRSINGKAFVTLKINREHEGGLTRRAEWEEPLTQERLDRVLSHVRQYVGTGPFPVEAIAEGRRCGSLGPVLEVRTVRLVRPIGTEAELVLDTVEYPGIAAHPFFDIEVESKAGKAGERLLRAVEAELHVLAGGHLTPARMSKLERGLMLKGMTRR